MSPFAIYFPQFYPTPTNDAAWGQGFTDWTLVSNANLRDLWKRRAPQRGFYDGARVEVHLDQMREMRQSGLGGVALYHYWFYSHQELGAFESTLLGVRDERVLPWFLLWATEGWSRRWLGDPSPIVTLSARPLAEEVETHCDHLARCFDHPGYLRIDGQPVFVWYHLGHFASPADVLDAYRAALGRRGHDPTMGHFVKNPFDLQHCGLVDFTYLFEPRLFFGTRRLGRGAKAKGLFDAVERVVGSQVAARFLILIDRLQQAGSVHSSASFLDYLRSEERNKLFDGIPGVVQEVLSPGWNNVPRYSQRFTALDNVPAERFSELVRAACSSSRTVPPLINAWNEWSEGAAIEPCAYLGTSYLDAIQRAMSEASETGQNPANLCGQI